MFKIYVITQALPSVSSFCSSSSLLPYLLMNKYAYDYSISGVGAQGNP